MTSKEIRPGDLGGEIRTHAGSRQVDTTEKEGDTHGYRHPSLLLHDHLHTVEHRTGSMGGVPHQLMRYTGFVGANLLAVAAFLGGALPTLRHGVTPVTIWQGEYGPLIITLWLAGTSLLAGAWWKLRDHVPSARWAYVTIGLWLLPLLLAPPLASRDVYAYACQGATYAAGFNPYEQGVSALPCPWLDSISLIWRDTPAPYGPLFVLISGWVVASTASLSLIVILFRMIAVTGVALTALSLPVLARACGVPVKRALWLALASPLVGVHMVSGAHNDALMIGLLVGGLAVIAAKPGRSGALLAGGVLLGLAAAIKVTAAVVVPFAAVAAIAGPYRFRALLRDGGWVVGGAVATVVAVTITAGLDFGWIAGLSRSGDAVQWSSPPTAVGQTVGYIARLFGAQIDAVPAVRAVGVAVLAVILVVLWWRHRTREPLYGAGLALAATVALAPVFHPWYAVWPLTVLAATAIRGAWFGWIALVTSFFVLPDGTGLPRYSKMPGAPLMTLLVILAVVYWIRAARGQGRAASRVMLPPDRPGAIGSRK
ncbi:MAG TPA: polyprenol phosphomannose-dependent alpha 1,6 mannosyltransferase MptB [Micromonospora sp.]|nr:polyprenol phosphomannose-dependent alpha 1,6 mannosyltransferase MptB [Micromonospora sp.]